MKKLSSIFLLGAFTTGITMSGCKKALDIQPSQSIDNSLALSTREGINANISGLYSKLKSARLYGRDLIALPEALSDNGYATNKSGRLVGEANNSFRAHFSEDLYRISYQGINEANLLLAAFPNVTATPPITAAERAGWQGQTYFLRALNYFNLIIAYAYMPSAVIQNQNKGGVPLFITGISNQDSALNRQPSRASIDDVYALIVSDLEAANERLSGSAPNVANKAAAQALLSRVHLYRGDMANAKRWSDSCINGFGSKLASASGYVNQWRVSTHQETLFQIAFASSAENVGVNESLQTSFTTLAELGNRARTGGFGDLVPTISLLNDLGITLNGGNTASNFRNNNASIAARSADVRNLLYEVGTTGRGKSYVECTKYFGKNGFINLDNVPVIRIAEMYLNRAEAEATPGSPVFDEAAALNDLNKIATNRGLPAFVGLSGSALFEEIFRQRRIELAFEGHRFWDLKRLGRDLIKSPLYPDVAFSDIRILAPIPQREIDYSPTTLVQNPGY